MAIQRLLHDLPTAAFGMDGRGARPHTRTAEGGCPYMRYLIVTSFSTNSE